MKGLLADLQKRYGSERVMMASDIPVGPPISTGTLALDCATNYGGFPNNRVVELYGREGTGKTTLALRPCSTGCGSTPIRARCSSTWSTRSTPTGWR